MSKEINGIGKAIEDFLTKILDFIGIVSFGIIAVIFKFIGLGIKYLWKNNKKIFILMAILTIIISSLIYFNISSNQIYTIYPGLIFLTILFFIGLGSKRIIWTTRSKKNIFEKINFKDRFGNYPTILKKQKFKKDKKNREMYVIKSLIPITEWKSKKELLEQLFNSKIGIRKTANRQIIKLFLNGGN